MEKKKVSPCALLIGATDLSLLTFKTRRGDRSDVIRITRWLHLEIDGSSGPALAAGVRVAEDVTCCCFLLLLQLLSAP